MTRGSHRARHVRGATSAVRPSRDRVASAAADDNRTRRDGPASPAAVPFANVIDISDIADERRALRRRLIVLRIVSIVLLIAAVCVAGFPIALQYQSSQRLSQTSSNAAQQVAGWPYPQAKNALAAARAYNEKLAKSGQPVLGEAVDPFTNAAGGSKAKSEDSAAAKDKTYQSLLDSGNGVMGTIRIPKISVDLPIYHGTSEEALASGAGHLYGTSLPVGGKSTHSVITGHRGLVEALMFTRLDEMRNGDFFYIEVMGETIGYRVDRISVIKPTDTSRLKITPGEDRVTLMTCTPYGVNTHRLLVSGHRVAIPVPAPYPGDVHDARTMALLAGLGTLIPGWFLVTVLRRIRRMPWRAMHHAALWPRRW